VSEPIGEQAPGGRGPAAGGREPAGGTPVGGAAAAATVPVGGAPETAAAAGDPAETRADPWRGQAGPLFDRNAAKYDRINRIITLGGDRRWRHWLAGRVPVAGARVLDACAGTGAMGLELAALGARVTLLDASAGMLELAHQSAQVLGLSVETVVVDLEDVAGGDWSPPVLAPGGFGVVSMAFGLRYFVRPQAALEALRGTLAPDGRLLLVDAVCPPPGLVGAAAGFYFFQIAPRVATRLAGRRELYDSLTASVRALGTAERVRGLLRAAGFALLEERTWAGGLVYAVVARPV
jgi:demethylmenaquinone methyltransferase/2-methoxy-6-polyprenyl-1,4-benzoquinol methylase